MGPRNYDDEFPIGPLVLLLVLCLLLGACVHALFP